MLPRSFGRSVTTRTNGNCLLVANYAPDVGYAWWLMEHYWVTIAHALRVQGRRSLLAYPAIGVIPEAVAASPIEVHWLDFGDRSAAGRRAIRDLVIREHITSVYLTDRAYSDWRYRQLRGFGVNVIAVHDHSPGSRPPAQGFKGWIKLGQHKITGLSADWFIAVSDFVRDRMIENARVPMDRAVVVPNGVVSRDYDIGDRRWAREQLGVSDAELVVGMVARAHRIKGIDLAIRAAPKVLERLQNAVFAFVGDGPHLESFRELAGGLGIASRFRFLGRRSDARRLMAGFDVGLHPSLAEVGYCLAILEMMNAGLPVVVPDELSVNGATEPGITGLWYRPGEADDMARQLLKLLGNPSVRAEMGARARERTLTRFSLTAADRALLEGVVSRL